MNKIQKIFTLLAALSLSTIMLQARISNVTYNLAADATNAGKPAMDPGAGTLDVLSTAMLNLSFLDLATNSLVLAETTSLSAGEKALMLAKTDGSKVTLSTLAPVAPTVTRQLNDLTDSFSVSTNLQAKNFGAITVGSQKTVLRGPNLGVRDRLFVVDNANGNFIEAFVKDGNSPAGLSNIDDVIVIGNKIVCGVFQNTQITYNNNAHGRIRVLDLATGAQIGVAKRNDSATPYATPSATYVELVMNSLNAAPNTSLHGIIGTKEVERIGSMHWDASLQRLFIGFTRTDGAFLNADKMPFLVGRFEGNDLLVEPLAPLGAGSEATSSVVSFYDDFAYTIPFIKTLHIKAQTAAGVNVDNPYLVSQINYNTGNSATCRCIFAVPLVGNSAATAVNLGKVADITAINSATPAAAVSNLSQIDLPTTVPLQTVFNSDVRALVGGAAVPVDLFSDIKCLEVIGHTVLASTTAGSTALASQAGVWASTAIIDENGAIVGWTAWNRVAGIHEQVYNTRFNASTGHLWTVHADVKSGNPTNIASISIPSFGDGMRAPKNANGSLPGGVTTYDPHSFGSIGFKVEQDLAGTIFSSSYFQANRTPGLSGKSLVAFGGKGRIVLAKTGTAVASNGSSLSFTEFLKSAPLSNHEFEDDAIDGATPFTHYQLLDGSATNFEPLAALGNIYAIEVARARGASQGWLFAGGENGLVVFSNAGGNGWNSSGGLTTQLANLQTEFVTNAITPKKVTQITGPVVGLAGISNQDGTSNTTDPLNLLLVLTKTGLSRITLPSNNFVPTVTPDVIDLGLAANEYCLSLKILSHHSNSALAGSSVSGVVVTTQGVYVLNNLQDATVANIEKQKQSIIFGADIANSIRRVQILPRAPYAQRSLISANAAAIDNAGVVANLLVVTGTINDPASAIYMVPLKGTQYSNFTAANGLQSSYALDETATLTPVRLAGKFDLGLGTIFTASVLGLPISVASKQSVHGHSVSAHVDVLGGSQLAALGDASFTTLNANYGGSGSLILADRNGNVTIQE